MSKGKRRLAKLELSLTPKQAVLLWMQEAHQYDTMGQYAQALKGGPDYNWPLMKLPEQVATAVEQAMKGRPRPAVARMARQAILDVLFLFHLHQKVNGKLMEEDRHYWTKALLLSTELDALRRERALRDRMTWAWFRVGMELPYPLDPEAAAAVEAVKAHYVLTWELLEEGEDLLQWVADSFVAQGRTPLPEDAYLLIEGARSRYIAAPGEDEVRALFREEAELQKSLAGEDYQYGLADVPDAEFEARYDAVLQAMKGLVASGEVQAGVVVELPTVPHHLFRDTPLVEGEWLDRYIVELAEWGARLQEKGYQLQEADDSHPMAWHRIVDQDTGTDADAAVLAKLRHQTRQHLARFSGQTREIGSRVYLCFMDYARWCGRRVKGSLEADLRRGLVVSSWNRWVEAGGGDGVASLDGVPVGWLRCYLEGYQYQVCSDPEGLAEEKRQRETLLENLRGWQPGSRAEQRFHKRLHDWKDHAEDFLYDLYSLRQAVDSISRRYFGGQPVLFREPAEDFGRLLTNVERLVEWYMGDLAGSLEQQAPLPAENTQVDRPPQTIDTAALQRVAVPAARQRLAFLVDMARAEALDALGENQAAVTVMERHV